MAWTKIKITPLGRRTHSARHRPKAVDRSKCQEQYSRRQDTENRPPNLDYNVIEEIADGVEKMILSWSHPKGGAFEEHGSEDIIRPTPKKDASVAWTLPACNEVHHPSHAPSCKSHGLIAAMNLTIGRHYKKSYMAVLLAFRLVAFSDDRSKSPPKMVG